MQTSGLYPGMEVKNYKELCRLLGEPVKGGKSKIYQLKNWERYFDFFKEGVKYYIIKVYEKPYPKQSSKKRGSNSKYKENLEPLLLDLISGNNKEQLYAPSWMLCQLSMVNNDYRNCLKNMVNYSKERGLDLRMMTEFFDTSHKSLIYILERRMDALAEGGLLSWEKRAVVESKNGAFRLATKAEEKLIKNISVKIIKEIGCKHMGEVLSKKRWSEYVSNLNNKLLEKTGGDIKSTHRVYLITTKGNKVFELTAATRGKHQNKLNELIVVNQKLNVVNRQKNKNIRKNESYIAYQHFLIEKLIKVDT